MPEFLVVKPSSLGDIVHGLQVIEALRTGIADSRVSWIAASAFAPLVRSCATVNGEVFVFERNGGLGGFLRLIRELRRHRFDAVLDLQGLARSGLMTVAVRSARKIGRADARELAGCFYRERVTLPPQGRGAHAIDILLQFLPRFGLPAELAGRLRFDWGAAPATAEVSRPEGAGPAVLMFPASRRVEKNWLGFAQLTQKLLERRADVRVVWAGHEESLLEACPDDSRFVNLTGQTGIAELPALIDAADCVVANDSGPMHLAAALRRRVIALFGPTDPARFGPYPIDGMEHIVVRAPAGDLARLDVDAVLERLLGTLGSF